MAASWQASEGDPEAGHQNVAQGPMVAEQPLWCPAQPPTAPSHCHSVWGCYQLLCLGGGGQQGLTRAHGCSQSVAQSHLSSPSSRESPSTTGQSQIKSSWSTKLCVAEGLHAGEIPAAHSSNGHLQKQPTAFCWLLAPGDATQPTKSKGPGIEPWHRHRLPPCHNSRHDKFIEPGGGGTAGTHLGRRVSTSISSLQQPQAQTQK